MSSSPCSFLNVVFQTTAYASQSSQLHSAAAPSLKCLMENWVRSSSENHHRFIVTLWQSQTLSYQSSYHVHLLFSSFPLLFFFLFFFFLLSTFSNIRKIFSHTTKTNLANVLYATAQPSHLPEVSLNFQPSDPQLFIVLHFFFSVVRKYCSRIRRLAVNINALAKVPFGIG